MPVAPAESLARKWFLPRNRMSELFTYGSVGGVGYNLGATRGKARSYPERDGTGVSIVRNGRRYCDFAGCQQLAYGPPVSSMPYAARGLTCETSR